MSYDTLTYSVIPTFPFFLINNTTTFAKPIRTIFDNINVTNKLLHYVKILLESGNGRALQD